MINVGQSYYFNICRKWKGCNEGTAGNLNHTQEFYLIIGWGVENDLISVRNIEMDLVLVLGPNIDSISGWDRDWLGFSAGIDRLALCGWLKLTCFLWRAESDLAFVLEIKNNFWLLFGWPNLNWFSCANRKWLGFCAGDRNGLGYWRLWKFGFSGSAENDVVLGWGSILLLFVGVVEMDSSFVWRAKITCVV